MNRPHPPEDHEIAVIGIGCRFPEAPNPAAFWTMLREGRETIRDLAEEELLAAGVSRSLLSDPAYVRRAAIIDGIEQFDPGFFGMSPAEAALLDPQARMFLECAFEALDSAGLASGDGPLPVGVFGGVGVNSYFLNNIVRNAAVVDQFGTFQTMIANDKDYLSTLVSYRLNLTGPAITVQSACSTSLVAVHMACQSLLEGECDYALAGGSTLSVPQAEGYLYQPGMILSPDGRCRPFSAQAAGTVNGSGAGIVLLQRLEDALASNAHIHAIIRGSAINNDGAAKVGYTAPSVEGQARVIAEAQRVAGIAPDAIGFVEAHGTATPLGDPIEVEALAKVWRQSAAVSPCYLGSLKGNMGHAGAAAGIAGLIKAVLAVEHGEIPPTLHFDTPHPELGLEQSPFRVNAQPVAWDVPERIAAASSFGIGGTNAHVVVSSNRFERPQGTSVAMHVLPVSAAGEQALVTRGEDLAALVDRTPGIDLGALAGSLASSRRGSPFRSFAIGRDAAALGRSLRALPPGRSADEAARHTCFMFTGHGAQSVGMGRQLYREEPAFRQACDQLGELLHAQAGIDLALYLDPPPEREGEAEEGLTRMAVSQPVMYVVQLALCALLRSRGIVPETVIGHSSGEFAAAASAGVFSAENGLRLVIERGRLMDLSAPGGMIALTYTEAEIRSVLEPELEIAVINAPELCVVSGAESPLAQFVATLDARGVPYRHLHVSKAAHSPTMLPLADRFAAFCRTIPLQAPALRYVSAVTGGAESELLADPAYWARHLCNAVRFGEAMAPIATDPQAALWEIGPGNALSTFARMAAPEGRPPLCLSALPHPVLDVDDEATVFARSVGQFWQAGGTVHFPQLSPRIALPPVRYDRLRCWVDPEAGIPAAARRAQEDWFGAMGWHRAVARPAVTVAHDASPVLLLADGAIQDALAGALAERDVCIVAPGTAYRRTLGSATVRPAHHADWERLLVETGARLVIHAWTLSDPSGPGRGFASLAPLARALARQPHAVDLLVLTRGVFAVSGTEKLVPDNALLLGPVRVLPQEAALANACLVDLESTDATAAIARHIGGCIADSARPRVEAWRGTHRWLPVPEPLAMPGGDLPLRAGDACLITGGLGGLGLAIATRWAAKGIRVALTTRRPISPPETWATGSDPALRQVAALVARGADIIVRRADCADEGAMRAVFDDIEKQWGPVRGVVHAAGEISRSIHNALDEFSPELADAQFAGKCRGADVLCTLLPSRDPAFVVLTSSLAAVVGGLGFTAYAAANAYLDTVATRMSGQTGQRWISINLDRWTPDNETGEAEVRAFAESSMSPDEGYAAFCRVLASAGEPQVMISPTDVALRQTAWMRGTAPEVARDILSDDHQVAEGMNEGEARLAAIWRALLGHRHISPQDSFIALGGHSLLATRLIAQIRAEFGADLPLRYVFDTPVLTDMAAKIAEQMPEGAVSPAAPDLRPALPVPPVHGSVVPLSASQKQIFATHQQAPDANLYAVSLAVRLSGRVHVDALIQAFAALIQRHEILRTCIDFVDGEPAMRMGAAPPAALEFVSLDHADCLADELAQFVHLPFDLRTGPLIRARLFLIDADEHVLAIVQHHIITDGWSLSLLLAELFDTLKACEDGKPPCFSPPDHSFRDVVAHQANSRSDEAVARSLEYWRQALADMPQRHALQTDRQLTPARGMETGSVRRKLGATLTRSVAELAVTERATPYLVLLSALASLLYRLTGQVEQPVVTVSANRQETWQEHVLGLLAEPLVVPARAIPQGGLLGTLRQLRETTLEAHGYAGVPLHRIVEELNPPRQAGVHPLSQIGFVVQNFTTDVLDDVGLHAEIIATPAGASEFDLLFSFIETSDGMAMSLDFAEALFDKTTVETLADRYLLLLEAALAAPDRALHDLPIMQEAEMQDVLGWGARPTVVPPPASDLVGLWRERAAQTPDAVALECAGTNLTHTELAGQVADCARALATATGAAHGDVIAVSLTSRLSRVIAFLAIRMLGAVYLPLDPTQPEERLDAIRDDARPLAEISDAGIVQMSEPLRVEPDTAYVIHTSGSTGRPKGVLIGQAALDHLACHLSDRFSGPEPVRIMQMSAPGFDAWIWEVIMAAATGGTLVCPPDGTQPVAEELAALLREYRVTLLTITPPALAVLPTGDYPDLRLLITAGADLPVSLARRWAERRTLVNAYGPTETTVCATMGSADPESGCFDIGEPFGPHRIWLLDADGNLVPEGVVGEIHVGGPALAQGYLRQEDLTRAAFRPNPVPGFADTLLYATGDRAKWRRPSPGAAPRLVYLGRNDHQLKLRGLRVEPGEVEARLTALPGIEQARVLGWPVQAPETLAGFVSGAAVSLAAIRRSLLNTLPAYMVPGRLFAVDRMPLTSSGKIDDRRLVQHAVASDHADDAVPMSAWEARVAAVVASVLGVDDVPIDFGFFDIGGSSLSAVRLCRAIERELGRPLALPTLTACPSLRELAALLGETEARTRTGQADPHPAGSTDGPPSFWFPGIEGHGGHLQELAHAASIRGPAYVLPLPGADGRRLPDMRLRTVIARHVETIRRLQPEGPYWIGGHSFGGLVAFAVARTLTELGATVGLLTLVDAPAPACSEPQAEFDIHEALLRWYLGQVTGHPLPQTFDVTGDHHALSARLYGIGANIAPADLQTLEAWLDVIRALLADHPDLPDEPLPLPALVLAATQSHNGIPPVLTSLGEDLGWHRFLQNAQSRLIEGDHASILRGNTALTIVRHWLVACQEP